MHQQIVQIPMETKPTIEAPLPLPNLVEIVSVGIHRALIAIHVRRKGIQTRDSKKIIAETPTVNREHGVTQQNKANVGSYAMSPDANLQLFVTITRTVSILGRKIVLRKEF